MFQKSSYKNRPIIYYLGTKIPCATILYNESKHNILLALVGEANKLARKITSLTFYFHHNIMFISIEPLKNLVNFFQFMVQTRACSFSFVRQHQLVRNPMKQHLSIQLKLNFSILISQFSPLLIINKILYTAQVFTALPSQT
jgi:hypothetical protein